MQGGLRMERLLPVDGSEEVRPQPDGRRLPRHFRSDDRRAMFSRQSVIASRWLWVMAPGDLPGMTYLGYVVRSRATVDWSGEHGGVNRAIPK